MKVSFDTTRFEQAHGRHPSGHGSWVFLLKGVGNETLGRLSASRSEIRPRTKDIFTDQRISTIDRSIYDKRDVQVWCVGTYGEVKDMVRRLIIHALIDHAPACCEPVVYLEP